MAKDFAALANKILAERNGGVVKRKSSGTRKAPKTREISNDPLTQNFNDIKYNLEVLYAELKQIERELVDEAANEILLKDPEFFKVLIEHMLEVVSERFFDRVEGMIKSGLDKWTAVASDQWNDAKERGVKVKVFKGGATMRASHFNDGYGRATGMLEKQIDLAFAHKNVVLEGMKRAAKSRGVTIWLELISNELDMDNARFEMGVEWNKSFWHEVPIGKALTNIHDTKVPYPEYIDSLLSMGYTRKSAPAGFVGGGAFKPLFDFSDNAMAERILKDAVQVYKKNLELAAKV